MLNKLKKDLAFRLNPYPFKRHQIKNNYLFIHIPKNAGTALRDALGDKERNRIHLPYFVYRNANRDYFNDFYKFTIVRNPWDRVVSVYAYLKAGGNQFADKHYQEYFEQNSITFEKFVLEFLTEQRMHSHSMFRPQFPYIYDERERLMVDYVGYQENLGEALQMVSKKLHLGSSTLKDVNKSDRSDYRSYYTSDALIERVAALYAKDIELLNYRFE